MTGIDIPIPDLQLILHQPTIKEISYVGEQDFFTAIHYLCLNKENLVEDKSLLQDLTNFQVLMKVIDQFETKEKKTILTQTLSLFFPNYSIGITPNSIFFLDIETRNTVAMIDSNNFHVLQDIIKEVSCIHSLFNQDEVVYNPQGELAKKIADKIYAGRRKKAALQEKKKIKESILSRYLSILTVGIGSMSLHNCTELTMYQLFDLVDRYSLYLNWDIDIRARLAGAQPNSETENWMKNIH